MCLVAFVSKRADGRVKPLDVEIMKRLGTRVNLIPVIAKADTMTPEDLDNFKIRVRCRPKELFSRLTPGSRSDRCAEDPDLRPANGLRG